MSYAIATGQAEMSFESFLPERQPPMNPDNMVVNMRKEYDFSNAKKNPYASMLKKQITLRLDQQSIDYFKSVSAEVGIPYQSLINLYLRECAASNRKLNMQWE
ncbi:MAG: BrnA antitoxin family protein [Brachymonas sp.]|nr:BrnA antitoxin family protein [Brachymonas sp.]